MEIKQSESQELLCRLCAERKEEFISIFHDEGQKLDIEAKINKCLRIQISISDILPLVVCIDCCVLLNQTNEFYDKTNLAQNSLQQLYESKQEVIVFESIEDKTNEIDSSYESVEQVIPDDSVKLFENNEILEEIETQESTNQDNNKIFVDISFKHSKKKLKKKKFGDFKFVALKREGGYHERGDEKAEFRIPDNYMTGTESDIETVLAEKKINSEPKIMRRKRNNDRLDRYPWLCTDCNDKSPSLEALRAHHKTVHNQEPKYMCVQCCKIYDKYYGFSSHVKRHTTKTKYNCEDCGKSFEHKKVLDTHRAIHSDERPHVCQTCGKAFRQQSALYIHSRCHLPDNVKFRYPCDQCEKKFSTKPNLATHKRIHTGVKNFTCDQCGKSFIQKGNLEAHFLTHTEDKPFKCSQCPKTFKTQMHVKKHETVHTGDKPYQCATCNRQFREKGTLKEHQRIHTGDMPFSCEFCGKCFRFKGILTTHRRQHTGERPYSCLECQHHFTNWPNFNKHMKRRHGIDTSHTKQMQYRPNKQSQEEAQEGLQSLQQQQEPLQQQQQNKVPIKMLPKLAPAQLLTPMRVTTSTTAVQVIQTVPQVTVTTQPIVLQTLSSSPPMAIQTFAQGAAVPNNTNFFATIQTPPINFLPGNTAYNIFNMSGHGIEHK